jgi:hypothetical protein
MTRWPWISLLLAVLTVISPVGREIIYDAFYRGEGLSRNIAQFVLCIGLGIVALIVVLEWLVRLIISRRRARSAHPVS